MKRLLWSMLIFVAAALLLLVVYSYWISRPLFDETRAAVQIDIAPTERALTFARTRETLLRVTSANADSVTGVDLSAALGASRTTDPLALYAEQGFDALKNLQGPERQIPLTELVAPITYSSPAIAAGTNFKEHAEEVYVDDPPFIFPKLSAPSNWNAEVPFTDRLDYEAELCLFPLDDIDAASQPVKYGLVLCNDFTDRWTLVQELDLSQPLGRTGFASGKGCEGCLTTGYLAVIPRDDTFYRELHLRLYVNDRLRQQFSMGDMILPIEEIVSQSFDLRDTPFARGDSTVPLMPTGGIPRGTLILTGTAAGVIFKPVNIWHQGFYLQPNDVVRVEASYLGHLENRIAEPE